MFVKHVQIDETVEQRNVNQKITILPKDDGNHELEALRHVKLVKNGERFEAGHDYEYVYVVKRNLVDIQDDEYTLPAELGGATISVKQAAAVIEMASDAYAQEDDPRGGSSSSSS